MDKSEQYIKMSKSALKDLKQYLPIDGDGCLASYQDCGIDKDSGKLVPLFRQDQLQEMVNENMNHVVKQAGITDCLHFKDLNEMMAMSWEQLWLAFVMKVKYNKIWNGENWEVVK